MTGRQLLNKLKVLAKDQLDLEVWVDDHGQLLPLNGEILQVKRLSEPNIKNQIFVVVHGPYSLAFVANSADDAHMQFMKGISPSKRF